MSEATPRPWEFRDRNWFGEPDPHNYYIVGGIIEPEYGVCEGTSTSVALVVGNRTSGDIPRANAELICRAVNSFDDLLAACEAIVAARSGDVGDVIVAMDIAEKAIAKARGTPG